MRIDEKGNKASSSYTVFEGKLFSCTGIRKEKDAYHDLVGNFQVISILHVICRHNQFYAVMLRCKFYIVFLQI